MNPPEKIPTYLHIDSFTVRNSSTLDIATQKITGAWVYLDNQLVGVYDLPGDIPIIMEREGQITLSAGIDYSGMKSYKTIYPFYNSDTFNLKPNPGQTVVYNPVIGYRSSAIERYKEDFEVGNTFIPINSDYTDDTTISRVGDPALTWGGKGGSGYIYLTPSNSYSQNINNTGFSIASGESFIEIDYKCSVTFQVGLQANYNGTPVFEPIANIKPSDDWNKLYIGLQEFKGRYQAGPYRLVILAELPDGQSQGYVLVDNIKVISY